MDTTELGNITIKVTYEKLPEKSGGACQYKVLANGVSIGILYREYEEGYRAVRGSLGGSKGGYTWVFYSPGFDAFSGRAPFFVQGTHRRTQREMKAQIETALDRPFRRLEEYGMLDGWKQDVRQFVAWLESIGVGVE